MARVATAFNGTEPCAGFIFTRERKRQDLFGKLRHIIRTDISEKASVVCLPLRRGRPHLHFSCSTCSGCIRCDINSVLHDVGILKIFFSARTFIISLSLPPPPPPSCLERLNTPAVDLYWSGSHLQFQPG